MKKHLKLIALFVVIAISAISLCSCQALDEKKANTARYTDDSKTEVMFRDQLYQQIDPGDLFFNIYYGSDYDLKVTDSDVPVLLSGWYGANMDASDNEIVLACGDTTLSDAMGESPLYTAYAGDMNTYSSTSTKYYVLEDQYDAVKSMIDSGELDRYYFEYWDDQDYYMGDSGWGNSDYDYDSWYSDTEHEMLLDDASTDAITRALKADKKEEAVIFDTDHYVTDNKIHSVIPMNRCDKDMILKDGYTNTCYLVEKLDKGDYTYYFSKGCGTDGKCELYPIDKDGYDAVERYFYEYPEACVNSDYLFDYAW